jgi:hypothetical protein
MAATRQRTATVLAGAAGRDRAGTVRARDRSGTTNSEWDVVSVASDMPQGAAAETKAHNATDDALASWTEEKRSALRNALKGAPWHPTKHQLRVIEGVMAGSELVQWLQTQNFAHKDNALEVGASLLGRKWIYPMRKSLRVKGFQDSNELFYSLDEERRTGGVALFGAPATDAAIDGGPRNRGVWQDMVGGEVTEVRIQERQRRSGGSAAPDGRYTADKMLQSDPPPWSMALDDVPMAAVGDASPDQCEWLTEWEVEMVHGRTDADGWFYMTAFTKKETLALDAIQQANVRFRNWIRRAQKIPKKQETRETDAPLILTKEEIQRRELLERAAYAMRPKQRVGTLSFTVEKGVSIPFGGKTFLLVDVGDETFRSPATSGYSWNLSGSVVVDVATTPLIVRVFKSATVGAPTLLGQSEFIVPENEGAGTRYLPLHGGRVGALVAQRASTRGSGEASRTSRDSQTPLLLGIDASSSYGRRRVSSSALGGNSEADPAVRLEWRFSPGAAPGLGGALEGDGASVDVTTTLRSTVRAFSAFRPTSYRAPVVREVFGQFVLRLTVDRAEDLNVNLGRPLSAVQRIANALCCSCCCAARMDLSSKLQIVLRYRGRFTDSTTRGPSVPLRKNPDFKWETAVPVNPSMPVVIEINRLDAGGEATVIGRSAVVFDTPNATYQMDIRVDPPETANPKPARKPQPKPKGAASATSSTRGGLRTAADIDQDQSAIPDVEPFPSVGGGATPPNRLDDRVSAVGSATRTEASGKPRAGSITQSTRTRAQSTTAAAAAAAATLQAKPADAPEEVKDGGRLFLTWCFEQEKPEE